MYSVKIQDKEYQVDTPGGNIMNAPDAGNMEICSLGDGFYRIKTEQGIHHASLLDCDLVRKQMHFLINQKLVTVDIKEPADLLLEKLGIKIQHVPVSKGLKAPMPGLVLKILVETGQEVDTGTPLLVLEAMKMENVYKAPHRIKIGNILVKPGQAVEKNQELINFEQI